MLQCDIMSKRHKVMLKNLHKLGEWVAFLH